jgi:hypothetical protein
MLTKFWQSQTILIFAARVILYIGGEICKVICQNNNKIEMFAMGGSDNSKPISQMTPELAI